jgi:hypothetical protein
VAIRAAARPALATCLSAAARRLVHGSGRPARSSCRRPRAPLSTRPPSRPGPGASRDRAGSLGSLRRRGPSDGPGCVLMGPISAPSKPAARASGRGSHGSGDSYWPRSRGPRERRLLPDVRKLAISSFARVFRVLHSSSDAAAAQGGAWCVSRGGTRRPGKRLDAAATWGARVSRRPSTGPIRRRCRLRGVILLRTGICQIMLAIGKGEISTGCDARRNKKVEPRASRRPSGGPIRRQQGVTA